ncbi:glutaminyl-peptide cyclotransferase [Pedobacter sp. AW31-3R]|uniref:glutaminyl-peptide cyclotransferase n=1 Tax=Pedobacter sp. AW31-3R TaxID=3445781 RepID=UPI003FA11557
MKNILYLLPLLSLLGCTGNQSGQKETTDTATAEAVATINYTVVNSYPHSVNAFTEGFLFHNGLLYESTGSPEGMKNTESVVGVVDRKSGEIDGKIKLDRNTYFGEGIVFLKDKLFQLTYKNQLCFVYDAQTFRKTGQYSFANKEGWGLTTDGTQIIMSDGTANLSYINPDNFQLIKTLPVTENGYALPNLNELEYIDGFIYANIWTTDEIVKIDPADGKVKGKLDITGFKNEALRINPDAQETNGIAYNPDTKKIMVTGKLWPKMYEIEFTK